MWISLVIIAIGAYLLYEARRAKSDNARIALRIAGLVLIGGTVVFGVIFGGALGGR